MNKNSQYIYSFDPIIPKSPKILILGSMPSVLSLEKRQFYGNEKNRFWNVLFYILENRPAEISYERKLEFLHRHKIALWDVINFCIRPGSLDSNIKDEQPNDIDKLLLQNNTIKYVFFNGTKAKEVYKKYFSFRDDINYILLPSTSPIPRKDIRNIDDLIEKWLVIKEALQD